MTIIRIPLFLAVFITALFTGYTAGASIEPSNEILNSQTDTMTMPDVTIPDNNQFNILIINVDNINQTDASLESIWLAAYVKNSSKINLIPVFPSTNNLAFNQTLDRSFYLDEGKPGQEFWDEMRKTNFWWNGYFLSDISASIKLIDAIGGVNIGGQELNGIQAVQNIALWENDPLAAVEHQKMLLDGICMQIAADQTPHMKAVDETLVHDIKLNHQAKVLITSWLSETLAKNDLACTFPTLMEAPGLPTSITP